MSDIAIRVESLSKRYRLGQPEPYKTLRESLMNGLRAPFRRRAKSGANSELGIRNSEHGDNVASRAQAAVAAPESEISNLKSEIPPSSNSDFRLPTSDFLWALRDVSFDVRRGEVLGIIGRNGAGKSTLLKILSRITEPTAGRAVIAGRVGSLLEVGTGFHPELTGRENIFLNGAILGMRRREIQRKFDEIVAFAELERFIDTPVKRYSSGMYTRLAFAVAAHLEPEILIVDEVLAVGDAAFQKKCLGKMNEVAREGRTVLFVSHNMAAVRALCTQAILLRSGQVDLVGTAPQVVSGYVRQDRSQDHISWRIGNAPANDSLCLTAVRVYSADEKSTQILMSGSDILVEFEVDIRKRFWDGALCIGFELINSDGITVLWTYQTDNADDKWPLLHLGTNRLVCTIQRGMLNGGTYGLAPKISIHKEFSILNSEPVLYFDVELSHGKSTLWPIGGNRPGVIAPILAWRAVPEHDAAAI